jgi:hypothetical protein
MAMSPGAVALLWAMMNGPPTALMLAFLARPICAVGPLSLIFMIAIVSSLNLSFGFVGADQTRIEWVARAGEALGLGVAGTLLLLVAVFAVGTGAVGWIVLTIIGRLYRARAITDQTLIIDSMFLLFAFAHALDLTFRGQLWLLSGLVAFVIYKIVSIAAFAVFRSRSDPAPRLLLLRVFSLGKRSERLFDAFGKLWRRKGSIRMIAGPDLLASTIEPHEFLDFLQGRLARRFIADAGDVASRLSEGDETRRFDGRRGVVELFCHDDTWRIALKRLVEDSDAVLMDLRGFTPSNRGCAYEIDALVDLAPLDRVVFVIDKTTDETFLRTTFAAGWASTSAQSPNRDNPAPRAKVFRFGAQGRDARRLVSAVATAAGGLTGP